MKRSLILVLTLLTVSAALAQDKSDPYIAAFLIEPTTKSILFEKNSHQPLPVASMTKMMTLLIAMEKIKEGELALDTQVTVSARASKMGGSQVYLKQGAQFPVRDLLAATMIHSANDAATALAEQIGGSNESFAQLMNQRAAELGMKESKFYTPHGLPGFGEPEDVMSAYDAAMVGVELMKFPLMAEFAAMQDMPFKSGTFEKMYNPNHLLKIYPGATGIKTGFHVKAGFCVTGSARKNNMDLVVVVMGTPPSRKRENFTAAAEILTQGFNNYKMVEVLKKGQRLDQAAVVKNGQSKTVAVEAGSAVHVFLKRGEEKNIETTFMGESVAPIRKGQAVGSIVVKSAGKTIGKVPAVASVDVEAQPWWKRWLP